MIETASSLSHWARWFSWRLPFVSFKSVVVVVVENGRCCVFSPSRFSPFAALLPPCHASLALSLSGPASASMLPPDPTAAASPSGPRLVVMERWLDATHSRLVNASAKLVLALEDPPEPLIAPRMPTRDLEAELLQGSALSGATPRVSVGRKVDEAQQLRADCERLLQQREQLRAQLIAEQERRERAERELVNVGAQWLGTDTQAALRQRADADRQRALDSARACMRACVHACMRACMHACMRACVHACMRACVHACMRTCTCMHACSMRACMHACTHAYVHTRTHIQAREAIHREANQRVGRLQAENTMLRQKLGKDAPSTLQLRLQLRAALQAELERERHEAREAVHVQLTATTEERDRLTLALQRAQSTHKAELELLRTSVRKAAVRPGH